MPSVFLIIFPLKFKLFVRMAVHIFSDKVLNPNKGSGIMFVPTQ